MESKGRNGLHIRGCRDKTMIQHDEYGEILNGEQTYNGIAWDLNNGLSFLVGWTDGLGSHYDILLSYRPMHIASNPVQGGIHPKSDLFVSIMRVGAFAFDVGTTDTHWTYYAEKLGLGHGATVEKLTEFINGIKIAILKLHEEN